jgi:hypothetical protein
VYCGIDIGSKTVKLSVVSMAPGTNASVKDERLCRRTLGMGALVFDSTTSIAKPLPAKAIDNLAETVQEYQAICRTDRGTMIGAGATQWARDATNIVDVRAHVMAATGLEFDVLSPVQEASYGYAAASLNTPGRLVLDPGSNSFQLAWEPTGALAVQSVLVEYGYVRGATNDFEPAADYATGSAAYQAKARMKLNEALARISPPMDLTALATLVRDGELGPDLVALGQDGAVQLAVRSILRDGTGSWVTDPKTYDARVARSPFVIDPVFGVMTAPPIQPSELRAFAAGISATDFKALMTEPVRSRYGQKALVVPSLVDLLIRELGLRQLVMVPQETTTGQILAKLPR